VVLIPVTQIADERRLCSWSSAASGSSSSKARGSVTSARRQSDALALAARDLRRPAIAHSGTMRNASRISRLRAFRSESR